MKNLTLLLLLFCVISSPGQAQQPVQPANPQAPAQPGTPPNGTNSNSSSAAKGIPTRTIPGFLIVGTVFNEKALSFPGVEVHVRQNDEKKYRWETATNSRGEFAVRVPQGKVYEVLVRVKKYKEQTQLVNSVNGDTQQRLSIKLEPAESSKKGAKP